MESTIEKSVLFQVAEIELVYKSKVPASLRPRIKTSQDVYEILMAHWDMDKIELMEQAKLILLNRHNKVLGIVEISSGGITGTVLDPRLIYAAALKANAVSIIVAHNHPSGNLNASESDKLMASKLREIGKLHDINFLESMIVTKEGYLSMADEGLF
jgi:DNA repair protein RadC